MSGLDQNISKAVKILWIDRDYSKAKEAYALLEQSVSDGNPDAYYFLARCHAGSCFVNSGFGFEENDEKSDELLDKSIENGSALGMFAARRFGGYKPRCGSFVQEPYHSDVEVWNAVCALAEQGEIFTKYLVANAYYYGDVIEMVQGGMQQLKFEEFEAQMYKNAMTAANIYEELLSKGMTMGVGNYIDIFKCGEYGVPKNEKKVNEIRQKAADAGEPFYMVRIASDLMEKEPERAREYLEKALYTKNYADAGFYLGKMYSIDGKLPRDLPKAKMLMENCLAAGKEEIACNNRLGQLYFYGGDGVPADYTKAFEHLLAAHDKENYWGSDMLGTCYLKGLGTAVDYVKAKEEFSRYPGDKLSAIGLGEIYAYGLGVKADIGKAMGYWNQFSNESRVIANKNNFKKTLFGWKRK